MHLTMLLTNMWKQMQSSKPQLSHYFRELLMATMLQSLLMAPLERERHIRKDKFIVLRSRMLGTSDNPGIMPLTMTELFRMISMSNQFDEYTVKVSYLEVYNETLKDLLASDDTNLEIREDPEKGIVVAGITELIATSTQEVLGLLRFFPFNPE